MRIKIRNRTNFYARLIFIFFGALERKFSFGMQKGIKKLLLGAYYATNTNMLVRRKYPPSEAVRAPGIVPLHLHCGYPQVPHSAEFSFNTKVS